MKPLLTDAERDQLLKNGAAAARGEQLDPFPVVRLFSPDAHATWLLTELDPNDGDTAYGLLDLGMARPELGHVKLSVLESIRGPQNLAVVRDLYFAPTRCLSEYLLLAKMDGSIND
jgi:hypothetical protein